jgi:DNA-binding CsgD family transcriptional regulator
VKELRRDDRDRGALLAKTAHARGAYNRGDFVAVYQATEYALDPGEPAGELHLLRARALLRELRPYEAEALLAPILTAFNDADSSATAAGLFGAAVGRRDPNAGLAILADAERTATRRRAHPAVRAEIAYHRAQTHWIRGDLADADNLARITEVANVDVLSVRATQLRGFVAVAQGRLADGLALFESARRSYERCREHDVDMAMRILQQIASLEQTLRSESVPGTHRARHGRSIPRASLGLGAPSGLRVRLCGDDAWLFALDGDVVAAYAKARDAQSVAPTAAWRVRALSFRAAIAAAFDEPGAAQTFADEAWVLAKGIRWEQTADERFALLGLAEVFASLGASVSAEVLSAFDSIAAPLPVDLVLRDTDDARLRGWEASVRAAVAQALGDESAAASLYVKALGAYRSCGYRWREAQTLIALSAIPPAHREGQEPAALDDAVAIVARHFPESFLARRLAGWCRVNVDPCGATLSPAQRDVLRYLLEGRAPREIAAIKGRGYETIRSHVRALHRAFGTRAEHQLVAECARRGIVPPHADGQRSEARARRAPRTS